MRLEGKTAWIIIILITSSLILNALTLTLTLGIISIPNGESDSEKAPIAIRIDDIQDYAFKESQLILLSHHLTFKIPATIGIIAGHIGEDRDIVGLINEGLGEVWEIASHGWDANPLAGIDLEGQIELLRMSKNRLEEIFGTRVNTFIPPMYLFDENTLKAAERAGYSTVSSHARLSEPGPLINDLVSVPATVEFSRYLVDEGRWERKTLEELYIEVLRSVREYGYAVVVTHPQEFVEDGEFDWSRFQVYVKFLELLDERFRLTFIRELRGVAGS